MSNRSTAVCGRLLRGLPGLGLRFLSGRGPTPEEFEAWQQFVILEAPRLHADQTLGSRVSMVGLAWRIVHHGRPPGITHVDVRLVGRPWQRLESLDKLPDIAGFVRRVEREYAWVGCLCEAVYALETLLEELPQCPASKWRQIFGPGPRPSYEPYRLLLGKLEALDDDMALRPAAFANALLDMGAYRDLAARLSGFFRGHSCACGEETYDE
jgi:hypothetical protein